MIPKIIHQMWLDKVEDNNTQPIPKYRASRFCKSFIKWNPTYTYTFWNMAKVRELFETHASLQRWRSFFLCRLKKHLQKCDFSRYAIMYVYGGLYVDCDFTCYKSLDTLLDNRELILTYDRCDVRTGATMLTVNRHCIFNGVFASVPGHPFWSGLMDYIMNHFQQSMQEHKSTLYVTGPCALGDFACSKSWHADCRPDWYVPTEWLLPHSAVEFFAKNKPKTCPPQAYMGTLWLEGTAKGRWCLAETMFRLYAPVLVAIIVFIVVLYAIFWRRKI